MITINEESRQRKRSVINIDNYGERFKTDNGIYTFTSPSLWVLEKHLFYLLRHSKQITFEQKYKYRPDYLSYDEYGTVVLGQLLMYVNGAFCLEDFDLDQVVVPDFQKIVEITKDKFPKKKTEELSSVSW